MKIVVFSHYYCSIDIEFPKSCKLGELNAQLCKIVMVRIYFYLLSGYNWKVRYYVDIIWIKDFCTLIIWQSNWIVFNCWTGSYHCKSIDKLYGACYEQTCSRRGNTFIRRSVDTRQTNDFYSESEEVEFYVIRKWTSKKQIIF